MKKMIPPVLLLLICVSACFADYSDGFITAGEYEYFVTWTSSTRPLIVEGGGANAIEMQNSSQLEVRSTSIPVNDDWHTGGITNIYLDDYSQLLYLGGITEEITIGENAAADLFSGRIDYITSMQYTTTLGLDPHIDLYAQPGWDWVYTGPTITGITGMWQDNTPFDIILVNDEDYDPVWTNINVIVPEPATLTLLGIGAFMLRRKK